jgi:hypothetical protein
MSKNLVTNIAVGAIAVTGAALVAKYMFSDQRLQNELLTKRVKYNKDNLPQLTLEYVKSYRDKALRGELDSWGSTKYKIINAYDTMVANNWSKLYWHPAYLIDEAYKAMNGVNFNWKQAALAALSPIVSLFVSVGSADPRDKIWTKISKLNKDQLRLFHNVWIENASDGYSFYDWVDGEYAISSDAKDTLLAKLSAAGVGQFINKKF